MADNICVSLKRNGERCGNKKRDDKGDGTLCGNHFNALQKRGANAYAILQLKYSRNREVRLAYEAQNDICRTSQSNEEILEEFNRCEDEVLRIKETYNLRIKQMKRE
jgi:hypothetical protein